MSLAAALKGQQLGPYKLLEHLTSGGMAEIFLARRQGEGGFAKDLVLKILQTRYAGMAEVVDMFLAEARLAAMLKHPNVVDVYDMGSDGGLHYIAMEHIPGQTLTDVMRRGIEVSLPLSLHHAAFIVAETAAGLAHIHDGVDRKGDRFAIVHRDISPTNLIVSETGQTKIIDFGIARQGDNVDTEVGARPGKVSYMSPEQVQGRSVDTRSDIFCLGTILYEITLGRRLWRGPKETVMRRIVEEKPPPPTYIRRDYPPDLEIIVQRALEKRPEKRQQTAGQMLEELQRYLANAGAVARNHDIARYLHDINASDAQISELGARRARAFADDEAPEDDPDALDFDRPKAGAGRALADALRAGGPVVKAEQPVATREARTSGPQGAVRDGDANRDRVPDRVPDAVRGPVPAPAPGPVRPGTSGGRPTRLVVAGVLAVSVALGVILASYFLSG